MAPTLDWRERLLAHVEKTETCWLWHGAMSLDGYGRFKREGRLVGAHRASYEMHVGTIPSGYMVLHRCDQPNCVNPAHLFSGTNSDNMRDASRKGRIYRPGLQMRGERHPNARLTTTQVAIIRSSQKSARALARDMRVSDRTIRNVRNGLKWKAR